MQNCISTKNRLHDTFQSLKLKPQVKVNNEIKKWVKAKKSTSWNVQTTIEIYEQEHKQTDNQQEYFFFDTKQDLQEYVIQKNTDNN